ncbi:MAG: hypothetical protein VX223_12690 [Myxococcota bacterium]|nr:hypothetical protein [Myxococcota bacterium]
MDTSNDYIAHRGLIGLCALSLLAFTGCPRKLTEKIAVPGPPVDCPEPEAPAAEPPAECLSVVGTIVDQDGNEKVLVAAQGFAKAVAVDEVIGSEGGKLTMISAESATVLLPDGNALKISKNAVLRSVPCDGQTTADAGGSANPVAGKVTKRLDALFRWRGQVIRAITRGYGIPVDMVFAAVLSQAGHREPRTAAALRALNWESSPDIGRAWINRIEVRDGSMLIDGHAPNQETFASIISRLKSANPVVSDVKVTSQKPDSGIAYTLEVTGPAISMGDLVQAGVESAEQDWPVKLRQQLDAAAQTLPRNNALGGFEADLKALAAQLDTTLTEVTRQANSVEEGYLGVVSFDVRGTGDTKSVLAFLSTLRTKGVAQRRVVVDPLVLNGSELSATLRVPYIAGKVDGRDPVPSLILPRMQSSRWKPARGLPLDILRDPIGAPTKE